MLALEMVEAPGASFPFSIKPILGNLEGGCYITLILPSSLSDLVAGRRIAGGSAPKSGGGGGDGGSGNKNPRTKC